MLLSTFPLLLADLFPVNLAQKMVLSIYFTLLLVALILNFSLYYLYNNTLSSAKGKERSAIPSIIATFISIYNPSTFATIRHPYKIVGFAYFVMAFGCILSLLYMDKAHNTFKRSSIISFILGLSTGLLISTYSIGIAGLMLAYTTFLIITTYRILILRRNIIRELQQNYKKILFWILGISISCLHLSILFFNPSSFNRVLLGREYFIGNLPYRVLAKGYSKIGVINSLRLMDYDINLILTDSNIKNMISITFLSLAVIVIMYNIFTLKRNIHLKAICISILLLGITLTSGLEGPLGEYYYIIAEYLGKYGFYASFKFSFLIIASISIMLFVFISEIASSNSITKWTCSMFILLSIISSPWIYIPYWGGNLKPIEVPKDYLTVMSILSSSKSELNGRVLFIPSNVIPIWLDSRIPDDPARWIFSQYIYVFHGSFSKDLSEMICKIKEVIHNDPKNLITVLRKIGVSYVIIRNDSANVQETEKEEIRNFITISNDFGIKNLYSSENLRVYYIPNSSYIYVENGACELIDVKKFAFDELFIKNKMDESLIIYVSEVWDDLWIAKAYLSNGTTRQVDVIRSEFGTIKMILPAKSTVVLYYQPSALLKYIYPIQIMLLVLTVTFIKLCKNA